MQHSKHWDHGILSHHFLAKRYGKSGNSDRFYFGGLQNHCGQWLKARNQRHFLLDRKAMTNLDSILKNRDITLTTMVHLVKAMVFPCSHILMWELNHKEGWAWKNSCFRTLVLEKILQGPLECKEIKSLNPKGNQPWIFIGRAHAEAPILWPRDARSQLIGKDCDAGQDGRQEEKGATEDKMVEWHHQLNACEFKKTLGDTEGQGSLGCCNPWDHKDLEVT